MNRDRFYTFLGFTQSSMWEVAMLHAWASQSTWVKPYYADFWAFPVWSIVQVCVCVCWWLCHPCPTKNMKHCCYCGSSARPRLVCICTGSFDCVLARRAFLLDPSVHAPVEDHSGPRRWKVYVRSCAFFAPQVVYHCSVSHIALPLPSALVCRLKIWSPRLCAQICRSQVVWPGNASCGTYVFPSLD